MVMCRFASFGYEEINMGRVYCTRKALFVNPFNNCEPEISHNCFLENKIKNNKEEQENEREND